MTVNAATIDLITEFEGFEDHWYPDAAYGWAVPTCAYGHTDNAGEPHYEKTKDKVFSKAEGREILARDLAKVEATVRNAVKVAINENQIGALVSFTYNCGEGNFKGSTLLKKVNAGMFVEAGDEFGRWNKAKGKVLKGLTRRRAAEAVLFARPVASPSAAPTTPANPQTPAGEAPNVRGIVGIVIAILVGAAGLLTGLWYGLLALLDKVF